MIREYVRKGGIASIWMNLRKQVKWEDIQTSFRLKLGGAHDEEI